VLAPLGVDDAQGGDEVGEDHQAEEWDDEEVKVGGEQGQDKASEDDVKENKEETACSSAKRK
jgi:hypothetical protein